MLGIRKLFLNMKGEIMNNKVLAAAIAAITFGSAVIPSSSVFTQAAGSYNLSVNVNLYGTQKSISPYIYGINDELEHICIQIMSDEAKTDLILL